MFSAYAFAANWPRRRRRRRAPTVVVAPARPADDARMPYGHDMAAFTRSAARAARCVAGVHRQPEQPDRHLAAASRKSRHFLQQVPEHVIVALDECFISEYQEPALRPETRRWLDRFPESARRPHVLEGS